MIIPKNICLTPFIFTTINPQGNQSPCPTLGGDLWDFKGIPLDKRWQGPELVEFRQQMLDNKQLPVCVRCHSAEAADGYSLRKTIFNPIIDSTGTETRLFDTNITPIMALDKDFYKNGPMQIVMKANNVCNLRCRSCNSNDSVLFKIEGAIYKEKYNLPHEYYTNGPDATYWTDDQLDEIFNFSKNLRRLEIYGGEPLLDKQTPKLLKKLVESGQSKKIQLNISTNVTIIPNDEWIDTVGQFEHFNLNLSIDGLGKHFEYIRHPAKWNKVRANMDFFVGKFSQKLSLSGNGYSLLPTITVSTLNIFYLPELITELKNIFGVAPWLNLVTFPSYYCIANIPDAVKSKIVEKLENTNMPELVEYINIMKTPMNSYEWDLFLKWTNAKDEYRNESFNNTFPEFAEVITKYTL